MDGDEEDGMATIRRRLIERREELGLTQEQVAADLRADPKSVYRYEHGLSKPRPGQRPRFAAILQWTTAQLAVALNDDGTSRSPDGHPVPAWLGHLASLEQAAGELWAFEPVVVHGLLQTPDYACAIESVGPYPINDDQVSRLVETRIARQAVLRRAPDPLELRVVLDESVLRRLAGDRLVMADQMTHLLEMSAAPNVDLRILRLDAGVFSAAFGSFTLFTSPEAADPYMACVEDKAGPHYLDRPTEIESHRDLFEYLSEKASPPAEAAALIAAAKEAYSNDE